MFSRLPTVLMCIIYYISFEYVKCFLKCRNFRSNKTLESCSDLRQLNPLLSFQLVTISNHTACYANGDYLRLFKACLGGAVDVVACSAFPGENSEDLILKYLLWNKQCEIGDWSLFPNEDE